MKIGTIGTGFIVDTFLSAVHDIKEVECVAMYSRKEESAKALAEKYHIEKIYTDLNELFADPTIDFVYVASPNSLHYQYTYEALSHGKHVICEKPFTSTTTEMENLVNLAHEKKLMLFEAITTIHLPNYQLVKEHIDKLGQIRVIQCNYSQYSSRYDLFLAGETPNVFNPKFSGGALSDLNIYNLHFVLNLFGVPETANYTANKHVNGIDTSGVFVLKYPEFFAECVGSKDTNGLNFALIQGEKGYIHVENGANSCKKVTIKVNNEEVVLNNQTNNNLLYYELKDFSEIYQAKDFERCYQLLDYSKTVMGVLEKLRKSAGIEFEADRN